jgi:hypothetical protein
MKFRSPPGMGRDVPIRIRVGNQQGQPYNFSYDPPAVDALVPNTPDAEGEALVVQGSNFGFRKSPVAIWIDNDPCAEPRWQQDANNVPYLQCTNITRTFVGPHSLTISVAGQTAFFPVSNSTPPKFVTECKKDFFGRTGEWCLPCMPGASCRGGEWDPVAQAGWFKFDEFNYTQSARDYCHKNRTLRPALPAIKGVAAAGDTCPYVVPCEPNSACLGANLCSVGYSSFKYTKETTPAGIFVGRCSQCFTALNAKVSEFVDVKTKDMADWAPAQVSAPSWPLFLPLQLPPEAQF